MGRWTQERRFKGRGRIRDRVVTWLRSRFELREVERGGWDGGEKVVKDGDLNVESRDRRRHLTGVFTFEEEG